MQWNGVEILASIFVFLDGGSAESDDDDDDIEEGEEGETRRRKRKVKKGRSNFKQH